MHAHYPLTEELVHRVLIGLEDPHLGDRVVAHGVDVRPHVDELDLDVQMVALSCRRLALHALGGREGQPGAVLEGIAGAHRPVTTRPDATSP
jgi:hypothetical protein